MKIVIIGAGASGIACALTLLKGGVNGKNIIMIDKGNKLEGRKCFVDDKTPCKKCNVCSIVHGVGGSGSYSDSKLNFDPTGRVGGDMFELMTEEEIKTYLYKTYELYKEFGIEEFNCKPYGLKLTEEGKKIVEEIKANDRLEISECVTIHLGTDNSRVIYKRMINYLENNGVKIIPNAEVISVINSTKKIMYKKRGEFYQLDYDKVILAMGRTGNKLMRSISVDNSIDMKNGRVDYGVRVECPNEIMKRLNEAFYECKIYFKGSFGDSARMFCSNPFGFCTVESYPYGRKKIYTANGHAYANKKSDNTNFAILVSRNFNEDLQNPLDNYVYPLANVGNSLGKGSVILQSLKDIKLNRRSTEERIKELDIVPTANVYKGDITSAIPYRTLVTILEFIEELDKIVQGINGENTLLYYPEIKMHSNKILIDKYGKTSVDDIYCIGDCSGMCRGLTTSISMGILCAENILKN